MSQSSVNTTYSHGFGILKNILIELELRQVVSRLNKFGFGIWVTHASFVSQTACYQHYGLLCKVQIRSTASSTSLTQDQLTQEPSKVCNS